jgi:putative transposon-encoded protein
MYIILIVMTDRYEIEGEEIVQRTVKPFGSGGAHVTAPKAWLGADIKLVRISDPTPGDDHDA